MWAKGTREGNAIKVYRGEEGKHPRGPLPPRHLLQAGSKAALTIPECLLC